MTDDRIDDDTADRADDTEPGAQPLQQLGDIRHLSVTQFAQLGLSRIAYVKPVIVNGAAGFAIHGADGTPMAVAGERAVAIGAILQHDMLPALVH